MTKALKYMTLTLGVTVIPALVCFTIAVFTALSWEETESGLEKLIFGGFMLLFVFIVLCILFVWSLGHLAYSIVILVMAARASVTGSLVAALITLIYDVLVLTCAIMFITLWRYGLEMCLLLFALGTGTLIMNIVVSAVSVRPAELLVN